MMQSYSARVLFERFYQVKVLEAIKASRNELGARMQHRLILRVVTRLSQLTTLAQIERWFFHFQAPVSANVNPYINTPPHRRRP